MKQKMILLWLIGTAVCGWADRAIQEMRHTQPEDYRFAWGKGQWIHVADAPENYDERYTSFSHALFLDKNPESGKFYLQRHIDPVSSLAWGTLPSHQRRSGMVLAHEKAWGVFQSKQQWRMMYADLSNPTAVWRMASQPLHGEAHALRINSNGDLSLLMTKPDQSVFQLNAEITGGGKDLRFHQPIPLAGEFNTAQRLWREDGNVQPVLISEFDLKQPVDFLTLSHAGVPPGAVVRYRISPGYGKPYGVWSSPVSAGTTQVKKKGRYLQYQILAQADLPDAGTPWQNVPNISVKYAQLPPGESGRETAKNSRNGSTATLVPDAVLPDDGDSSQPLGAEPMEKDQDLYSEENRPDLAPSDAEQAEDSDNRKHKDTSVAELSDNNNQDSAQESKNAPQPEDSSPFSDENVNASPNENDQPHENHDEQDPSSSEKESEQDTSPLTDSSSQNPAEDRNDSPQENKPPEDAPSHRQPEKPSDEAPEFVSPFNRLFDPQPSEPEDNTPQQPQQDENDAPQEADPPHEESDQPESLPDAGEESDSSHQHEYDTPQPASSPAAEGHPASSDAGTPSNNEPKADTDSISSKPSALSSPAVAGHTGKADSQQSGMPHEQGNAGGLSNLPNAGTGVPIPNVHSLKQTPHHRFSQTQGKMSGKLVPVGKPGISSATIEDISPAMVSSVNRWIKPEADEPGHNPKNFPSYRLPAAGGAGLLTLLFWIKTKKKKIPMELDPAAHENASNALMEFGLDDYPDSEGSSRLPLLYTLIPMRKETIWDEAFAFDPSITAAIIYDKQLLTWHDDGVLRSSRLPMETQENGLQKTEIIGKWNPPAHSPQLTSSGLSFFAGGVNIEGQLYIGQGKQTRQSIVPTAGIEEQKPGVFPTYRLPVPIQRLTQIECIQNKLWILGESFGKSALFSAPVDHGKIGKIKMETPPDAPPGEVAGFATSGKDLLAYAAKDEPDTIRIYRTGRRQTGTHKNHWERIAKVPCNGAQVRLCMDSKRCFLADWDPGGHAISMHALTRDAEGKFIAHYVNEVALPFQAEIKSGTFQNGKFMLQGIQTTPKGETRIVTCSASIRKLLGVPAADHVNSNN